MPVPRSRATNVPIIDGDCVCPCHNQTPKLPRPKAVNYVIKNDTKLPSCEVCFDDWIEPTIEEWLGI